MRDKKVIIRSLLTIASLAVLIAGICMILAAGTRVSYQIIRTNIESEDVVGAITSDVVIEQEIEGVEVFQGVRLLVATYGNPHINATYKMQIITQENEILSEHVVEASEFKDNEYYYLTLEDKRNLSNESLRIVISSEDAEDGNAITLWKSSEGDIVYDYITKVNDDTNIGVLGYRVATLVILFAFGLLNIWCPIKKLYGFIFKYRLAIVVVAFVILVANKIHYSSVGVYDSYVQTGLGSGYDEPIWGEERAIRSDEWLVSLPRHLTVAFAGTRDTNYIPMAMEMGNLTSSGIELGWGALTRPYEWGYLLGDSEMAVSWYWNFLLLFTVFFAFEMCLILSQGNKILSLIGAILIGYSSFFLWWFVAIWLMSGQGAIVCLYHAIRTEQKWKKAFFGIWTAIFGACFVVVLYPAWQVPTGYMYLLFLILLIMANWEKIKKFDKLDWTIIIGCIAFMVSIIGAHLLSYTEYMNAITNTVYPGERISVGGFALDKLANYIGSWMFSIRDVTNPSEASVIFNIFPLPMILGVFYMLKNKKWDGLIGGLCCLSFFFTVYCSVGIPMWLSKITLMSSSMDYRTVDVLALIQMYLFIVIAGRVQEDEKGKRLPMFVITFICVSLAAYGFRKAFPIYYTKLELLAIVLGITVCVVPWISKATKVERNISAAVLCTVGIVTGFMVNPVMKGLDVIYTKPVAQKIMSIVEEDKYAKWLTTDSLQTSGFTIACGAPTINSTNFIPNYELWEQLDSEGQYEEYWNRYAHMEIHLVDTEKTNVSLTYEDRIFVELSYNDLEKIEVEYIYASSPLVSTENVILEEIYNESGSYIYRVIYK